MAKFLESEKRRLANIYVQALYDLYEKESISEDEMDMIIEDIEVVDSVLLGVSRRLALITNNFSLAFEELNHIFATAVYPELKSNYSIQWIKEQIDRNHFSILHKSIKSLLKRVILLDIETPDYISITPDRKIKIYNFVKNYYRKKVFSNGKTTFIKLHFNPVKTMGSIEMDSEYKALANQLFDFEINIIEKKLLTV